MWRGFLIVASIACGLVACSDPPPSVPFYVSDTRDLELQVAYYANTGYWAASSDKVRDATQAHFQLASRVIDLPDTCRVAAETLHDAVVITWHEWPYDEWRANYAKYVDAQAKCEHEVDGKRYRRDLPANLMPHKRPGEYTG